MPNELYYKNISIEDFNQKFDSFESLSEKFEFLTDYLLSYGFDDDAFEAQNTNVVNLLNNPIEKYIHNAREKFIEAALKAKAEYNKSHQETLPSEIIDPNENKNSEVQLAMQKFIAKPALYLSMTARIAKKAYSAENAVDPKYEDDFKNWRKNLDRLSREFYSINKIFDTNEKDRHVTDVIKNVKKESNIIDELTSADLINRNKGGFFEKLFNTTSREYKAFERAFNDFNNKDSERYGNDEELERATRAYIRHKIPTFGDNDKLPDSNDVERFSGTSKKRLNFCLGVLKTINQRKERNLMTETINNKDLNTNNDQDVFQQKLNNDIKKDNEIKINNEIDINNNEIQVENSAENK